MADAAPGRFVGVAEYLAMERVATEKHVLWDGEIFAMAGGSPEHNLLVAAVLRELGVLLRGHPCRPYASDQRIRLPALERHVYPDARVERDGFSGAAGSAIVKCWSALPSDSSNRMDDESGDHQRRSMPAPRRDRAHGDDDQRSTTCMPSRRICEAREPIHEAPDPLQRPIFGRATGPGLRSQHLQRGAAQGHEEAGRARCGGWVLPGAGRPGTARERG